MAEDTAEVTLFETEHKVYQYLGARAEVWTVARSRNAAERCGERVVIYRWLDDAVGQETEWPAGAVVASYIEGNGWRPRQGEKRFKRLAPELQVFAPMEYAHACLVSRIFTPVS